MKKPFWIYLAVMIAGFIILAWPESNNEMMVRFSETHGPSGLDMLGIMVIALGYTPMLIQVFRSSGSIWKKLGNRTFITLIASKAVLLSLIVYSLYVNNDALLWASVILSLAIEGVLVFNAYSNKS